MNLSIIAAKGIIFNGEVNSVTLPGTLGPFQVFNNHAPILSSLVEGKITYTKNNKLYSFSIKNGFISKTNNKVIIVCSLIENNKNTYT